MILLLLKENYPRLLIHAKKKVSPVLVRVSDNFLMLVNYYYN